MKRKEKLLTGTFLIATLVGIFAWRTFFSTTQIAFINYQAITLGEIAKSNNNTHIKLFSIDMDKLQDIDKYDAILINGMGLRITEEQRTIIRKAADKGVSIITTMATNPANDIISTDSTTATTIKEYLNEGGQQNYRNMLLYIRRHIDSKTFDSNEPNAPLKKEFKQFYHIDPKAPDNQEALEFNSVNEYETFLKSHHLLRNNAPHIIITGQMGEPTELIKALEKCGNVVYPVRNMQNLIYNNQVDSIQPNAIINMAHGRVGDYLVNYLSKQNIPLFAPLNVNRLDKEWENDKMGMNGGFMSQSIVMPEIDGAILPYALFAHRIDKEGIQQVYAMPKRLDTFVQTISNYISLQNKPNKEKRVAIYYYKGPGQNALTAAGMEVIPSLYNLLVRMKQEGYHIENLPASAEDLQQLIQKQGSVFNAYANGAKMDFLKNGNPVLISTKDYKNWTQKSICPSMMADVIALDGEFPGSYISTDNGELALPRIDFGNVVLLPQLAAGKGDDDFAIVHGTNAAPPHAYIASYLWAQQSFNADVMIHFGTHGSLEFTPKKQVALSNNDWSDALVGSIPHLYIYSIGDVGEGIIAKRRSYAVLQSYLTPPFMESNIRTTYKNLCSAIQQYNDLLYAGEKSSIHNAALKVKRQTIELGIHRELRLDSLLTTPYTEEEIARIETFAEEIANEKITGEPYTMGKPYSADRIRSSVYAMSIDPIAYSLLALDKLRNKATTDLEKHKFLFTNRYLNPARELVTQLFNDNAQPSDNAICAIAGINKEELQNAREICRQLNKPQDMAFMINMMKSPKNMIKSKEHNPKEIEFARLITNLEQTIRNVHIYKENLENSPEAEFKSLINAMNGGYTAPSPGGDPITNPNTIPTGRNLYAINAEATPSEIAWKHGIELAKSTIEMYQKRHNDSIPRKVSYTLWSGEFVETEGATIAQILYMLGVEPIRDAFGRVTDIRLIPSEQLGRPRIDIVVQTSGQLRDIAASRLFLISRAVEMAAASHNDKYDNYVKQGVTDTESALIKRGISPKEAREISTHRVFGGINGNYGTGITDMVQHGDQWDNSSDIASLYLHNMGAFYGSEKAWEQVQLFALEAALTNTDAIIQPRQSNTWGALSLDHVYEFMGGMNLSVRNVTGKEPDAYMSDYRNHHNMRIQDLKEAIGVETRTTIFNPHYIQEKMRGKASAAAHFAEIIQNTYGWNIMKPEVIDNELWDELYNVYIQDKYNLNLRSYFEQQNPAALQEITAVMMETARKGMWKASPIQLKNIARTHTELVNKYKPSCSGFVCDNTKLREYIASNVTPNNASAYKQAIHDIRNASLKNDNKLVLKKEELNSSKKNTTIINNAIVVSLTIIVIGILIFFILHRRNKIEK